MRISKHVVLLVLIIPVHGNVMFKKDTIKPYHETLNFIITYILMVCALLVCISLEIPNFITLYLPLCCILIILEEEGEDRGRRNSGKDHGTLLF